MILMVRSGEADSISGHYIGETLERREISHSSSTGCYGGNKIAAGKTGSSHNIKLSVPEFTKMPGKPGFYIVLFPVRTCFTTQPWRKGERHRRAYDRHLSKTGRVLNNKVDNAYLIS